MRDFWKEAANVKPSRIQLDWYAHRAYAFIHFGINTFTGREWGTGEEDESLFAPRALDCRQWARVIRDAGLSGMILVAKHHDGFCLWDTAYTDHSVMKYNYPYKEEPDLLHSGRQPDCCRHPRNAG